MNVSKFLGVLTAGVLGATATQAEEVSLLWESSVLGQNTGYPTGTPAQSETKVGNVDIVTEANVFFKNLEYSNIDPIEGETFFGVIAPVRARYRASDKVTVELGAILAQNFGDDDSLETLDPIIRIVAEVKDDVYLIGGTILPTHWIHQAAFDDVNKLRGQAEQGFQLRIDKKNLKHDSWINWRVREGVIEAEEYEVGSTTQVRLFNDQLRLDAQALWAHVGGQISTSNRVENNLVALGGASWGKAAPFGWQMVTDARIGAAAFYSSDNTKTTSTTTGDGWEGTATIDLLTSKDTFVRLNAGYFNGSDLLGRRGDPLYGLDEYTQLGATGIWKLGPATRLEAGANAQHVDGKGQWTATLNLSWGTAFIGDFLKVR